MNSLVLVLGVSVIFFIAYITYGAWLAKQWGIDDKRKTPAHTMSDGIDYVPAKTPVLLGHHFSSIAGAGPITGPIAGAVFGWLPVVLWVIVGSIFFGGVHDFGSIFASIRHDGKSIGEVIEANMGKTGKRLFATFAWLTLLLVVAAFTNIVASTFVSVPEAAMSSMLFIALAVGFGVAVYRKGVSLKVGTVVGVILLFVCIWIGNAYPLQLSFNTWIVILLAYIFIASITPVWILLQPRDYLNSYLLYTMMAGAFVGLILTRPNLELAPVTSFNVNGQWLFPMLFITVACGAISGFHSLIGSGTSSKQVDKESDAKFIGYGSMLVEGVLAIVAIITAAYIGADRLGELLAEGGPVNVFSDGIGTFMTSFGLDFTVGKSFVALAVSAFALTSLDTATRLGRFIFQEFFGQETKEGEPAAKPHPLTNPYLATTITVGLGGLLAITDYNRIWPIFGSANQLLAALALMAIAVWLKNIGRNHKMFVIPMIFMFVATIFALGFLIRTNMATGNILLVIFPALLMVLAVVLAYQGYKALTKKPVNKPEHAK